MFSFHFAVSKTFKNIREVGLKSYLVAFYRSKSSALPLNIIGTLLKYMMVEI